MAELPALVAHGLPPLGLGRFVGSVIDASPRFAFYAVNAWRTDAAQQCEAVRQLGAELWLYGGPEHWTPTEWRDSRRYIAQRVRQLGAVGYIADPEDRWPQLARVERMRELRALGEGLAEDALSMRVGVSFFPGLPDLGELAAGAGGGVWCAVQVYGRDAFTASAFASWVRRAREHFGDARTVICIAGFVPTTRAEMGTPEGYARYLSMLPDAPANIVWQLRGLPRHMAAQLERRDVGGSALGSVAWGTLAVTARPAGIVLLVLAALVVVAVVFAVRRANG